MTQNPKLSETVGKNLKKLIKQSKYKTQERFATEGMNVDAVTVRRWISHGVRDVNTIAEISRVLNIDMTDLFK